MICLRVSGGRVVREGAMFSDGVAQAVNDYSINIMGRSRQCCTLAPKIDASRYQARTGRCMVGIMPEAAVVALCGRLCQRAANAEAIPGAL